MKRKDSSNCAGLRFGFAVIEYDILRVIVTLLVIIGHCTYFRILTPYGGCDYTEFTFPSTSMFYRITEYASTLIYKFHMPLYMALSGALFRMKNSRGGGGYASYRSLITDKAKKLLIPFIVVTLLFSAPLKLISGYYNYSDNLIKDIFVGQVMIQGNTHLWFLPTLFVIFIIIYSVEKYIRLNRGIILIGMFAVSYVSMIMPVMIMKNSMYYIFWFYVGYCFEGIRKNANKIADKRPFLLLICGAVFLAVAVLQSKIPVYSGSDIYDIIKRILEYVNAFLGCLFIYLLSYLLSKTRITERNLFMVIRSNTLGLYLYSDTWNYIILSIAVGQFGSAVFVTNVGAAMLFFSRIILSFTFALVISILLKKMKVKYMF